MKLALRTQLTKRFAHIGQFDLSGYHKVDEVPYDFLRKRLSILVVKDEAHLMITKGAVSNVLDVCSSVELTSGCHDLRAVPRRN